jgi:hypothetical protein
MTASESVIPDLLRRFVPTPYQCRVQLNGVDLDLHTNDSELISELSRPADHELVGCLKLSLSAKIVRDDDAPSDQSETIVLSSEAVVTILMGTGTILCLDCECRELLGFVAPHVSASDVVNSLLSLAIDLFRKQTSDQLCVRSGDRL